MLDLQHSAPRVMEKRTRWISEVYKKLCLYALTLPERELKEEIERERDQERV